MRHKVLFKDRPDYSANVLRTAKLQLFYGLVSEHLGWFWRCQLHCGPPTVPHTESLM